MGRILKGARLIDGKWIVSAEPAEELVAGPAPDADVPLEAPPLDLEALRAAAQAEADRLIAAAQAEAEGLRETARQEGYQAGFLQGEGTARAQWQAHIEALAAEAQTLLAARKTWFQAAESEVVRLALMVAERIVHRTARDPEAVAALVRALLAHLGDAAVTRIRVHPSDAAGLAGLPELQGVSLKADPAVGLGGVVVETLTGRIDARFATQFRELAAAVLMTDPAEDPVLGPALSELAAPLEAVVPAADARWKPV